MPDLVVPPYHTTTIPTSKYDIFDWLENDLMSIYNDTRIHATTWQHSVANCVRVFPLLGSYIFKGAILASAASTVALPVFSLEASNIVKNCLEFPKFMVSLPQNHILHW